MCNIQKINYITFCYKTTYFNSFDIKYYIIDRKWLIISKIQKRHYKKLRNKKPGNANF